MATDEERERRIREMEIAGLSPQEAEFAVAIELGEIPGDLIQIDDQVPGSDSKE